MVWDSLAITEYLAERHPLVWPEDQRLSLASAEVADDRAYSIDPTSPKNPRSASLTASGFSTLIV